MALGCVFQGLSQLFGDFVRVSGKPVLGMCVTGIGAVTNIILDAVFIIVFDWGVIGAASATVIGQIFSALFGTYLVFGNRTQVKISKDIFHLNKELCLQIISCGFAFGVAQMAMRFISLVYNSQFVQILAYWFATIERTNITPEKLLRSCAVSATGVSATSSVEFQIPNLTRS